MAWWQRHCLPYPSCTLTSLAVTVPCMPTWWFLTANSHISAWRSFLATGACWTFAQGRPKCQGVNQRLKETAGEITQLPLHSGTFWAIFNSYPKCPKGIESQLPTAPNCSVSYSFLTSYPSPLTPPCSYWHILVSPSQWTAYTHFLVSGAHPRESNIAGLSSVERRGFLSFLQGEEATGLGSLLAMRLREREKAMSSTVVTGKTEVSFTEKWEVRRTTRSFYEEQRVDVWTLWVWSTDRTLQWNCLLELENLDLELKKVREWRLRLVLTSGGYAERWDLLELVIDQRCTCRPKMKLWKWIPMVRAVEGMTGSRQEIAGQQENWMVSSRKPWEQPAGGRSYFKDTISLNFLMCKWWTSHYLWSFLALRFSDPSNFPQVIFLIPKFYV